MAIISDTDRDLSLSELRERFIFGEDIILSEDYYRDQHHTIEVFQKKEHYELLCANDKSFIAVANKHPMKLPVPWFNLDDAKSIDDFIEVKFLKRPVKHYKTE